MARGSRGRMVSAGTAAAAADRGAELRDAGRVVRGDEERQRPVGPALQPLHQPRAEPGVAGIPASSTLRVPASPRSPASWLLLGPQLTAAQVLLRLGLAV